MNQTAAQKQANEVLDNDATSRAGATTVDMKLEVVVISVPDVERATQFYKKLGWRQDVTPPGSGVVHLTPPGSWCSLQFGAKLTSAAPGSGKGYLIVSDIVAARKKLVEAGIQVSEIFHLGPNGPVAGLDPERGSYRSRATFSDPDGNSWLLQQITTRLPGRVDSGMTSFASASALASALRRAAAAHAKHKQRIGAADPDWPDWYAAFIATEQAGTELPA